MVLKPVCQIKTIVKFVRLLKAMAFRAMGSLRVPMVIILGATGTGKTKLSLELAQKFNTEIISADSMQIYKGLDVVTAKASPEERALAPHHLLDILEPHQMFTVVDFRNRALKIIDNLTEQGKIPIVVGGTNYYIESIVYKILVQNDEDSDSLLWERSRLKRHIDDAEKQSVDESCKKIARETKKKEKTSIDEEQTSTEVEESKDSKETIKVESKLELKTEPLNTEEVIKEKLKKDVDNEKDFTNAEIHEKLKAIDPVMATKLHPNNRRKILRSLEVWLKTGRRHSEVLDEQKLTEGKLRRPHGTIILWLRCDPAVHDKRLDARVDQMLEDGLVQELLDFHKRHNLHRIQDGKPPDYTKGVFQTLGFKEFHEYLILSDEDRKTEEGEKLLALSIENMKIGTRRYARRQNKMVRGRFLEHHNRQVPPIYELDTTDISKWDEEVKNKAINIIESFLNSKPCEYETTKPRAKEEKKRIDSKSANYCETCKRLIIGDKEFQIHLQSNRHAKVLKKNIKLAESQLGDQ